MISKIDYERLQEICKEINNIMLRSDLQEIEINVQNQTWTSDKNNECKISAREYTLDKKEFYYGSKNFHSDDKELNGFEYKWDYEEFIKLNEGGKL